ncbi:MAG: Fur family transcriptional regulator [Myxococcota bacterium]
MRRCRDRGLKATPQRLAVYRALLGTTEHPSPEALHRRVVAELPSLALGTVYKILDSLERVGLVEQVSLLAETKRYDGNQEPHHHLVCKICKDVVDYVDPALDVSPARLAPGFVPLEVRVQVVGVCARCHAS